MASPEAKARMPTSAPGSSLSHRAASPRLRARGFTLIELMVVVAIVAISASLVSLALRDGDAARLEHEGQRLTMLLETARAESRATGIAVLWVPQSDRSATTDSAFRFVGLPAARKLPGQWLYPEVSAQIVGGTSLSLGPEALIGAQRVVLRLDAQRLEIATDGLGPFEAVQPAGTPP